MQTVPGFAKGLTDGMPKIVQQEGIGGYVMVAIFHCIDACELLCVSMTAHHVFDC